jgi:hypothetical protein
MSLTVDGAKLPGKAIPLIDDHREHSVEVTIPASRTDALDMQSDIDMKIGAQAT